MHCNPRQPWFCLCQPSACAERSSTGVGKAAKASEGVTDDNFQLVEIDCAALDLGITLRSETGPVKATPLEELAEGHNVITAIFGDPVMRAKFISLIYESEKARIDAMFDTGTPGLQNNDRPSRKRKSPPPPKIDPGPATDLDDEALDDDLERMRSQIAVLESKIARTEERKRQLEQNQINVTATSSESDTERHGGKRRRNRKDTCSYGSKCVIRDTAPLECSECQNLNTHHACFIHNCPDEAEAARSSERVCAKCMSTADRK